MIDKLLLTFCVGCLLIEVHAVPRAFRGKCHLPADAGPCEAIIPRYYFNHETGECLTFNYGGCLGNNNNFPSLEDCMKECAVPKEQPSDVCSQPPKVGIWSCEAMIPSWTYDSAAGKCKKYIYGGCFGTGNLFSSKKECVRTCEHKEEELKVELVDAPQARANTELDRCAVDIVIGPCKGAIPSFGFDQKTGSCVPFLYGGCDGNGNRFDTKEECTKVCKHRFAKSDDKAHRPLRPLAGGH